jgi:hypothetical protein
MLDQVTRDFTERRFHVAEDVSRARRDPRTHLRNRNSHFDQLAPERVATMVDRGQREGYPGVFDGVIDRSLLGDRRTRGALTPSPVKATVSMSSSIGRATSIQLKRKCAPMPASSRTIFAPLEPYAERWST